MADDNGPVPATIGQNHETVECDKPIDGQGGEVELVFHLEPAPGIGAEKQADDYCPDVDGLRAVSVVGVVLYHVDASWLPGGFVGVDAFWVISGFVVTRALMRHRCLTASAFLGGFWARRCKRILPNQLLVVSVSALALCLIAGEDEEHVQKFMKVAMAGAVGNANNWLLISHRDYWDDMDTVAAGLSPFVHLWSLGVEDQFYLFYPLLVLLVSGSEVAASVPWAGSDRRFQLVMGALLLLSLAASWCLGALALDLHAFYLLPARFWEIAVGCIIQVSVAQRASGETGRNRALAAKILGAVSLLLLLGSFVFVEESRGFPFPQALAPVAGAAGCISAGRLEPSGAASRLLSSRGVVHLGKLSYSVYLWHTPVLALARWLVAGHLDWQFSVINWHRSLAAVQLSAILGLSLLSFRYWEVPWRSSRASIRLTFALSTLSAALVVLLLVALALVRRSLAEDAQVPYLVKVTFAASLAVLLLFCTHSQAACRRAAVFGVLVLSLSLLPVSKPNGAQADWVPEPNPAPARSDLQQLERLQQQQEQLQLLLRQQQQHEQQQQQQLLAQLQRLEQRLPPLPPHPTSNASSAFSSRPSAVTAPPAQSNTSKAAETTSSTLLPSEAPPPDPCAGIHRCSCRLGKIRGLVTPLQAVQVTQANADCPQVQMLPPCLVERAPIPEATECAPAQGGLLSEPADKVETTCFNEADSHKAEPIHYWFGDSKSHMTRPALARFSKRLVLGVSWNLGRGTLTASAQEALRRKVKAGDMVSLMQKFDRKTEHEYVANAKALAGMASRAGAQLLIVADYPLTDEGLEACRTREHQWFSKVLELPEVEGNANRTHTISLCQWFCTKEICNAIPGTKIPWTADGGHPIGSGLVYLGPLLCSELQRIFP